LYVIDYEERDEIRVDMPGAEKTTMRWLVGRRSGARTYAMRYFEIEAGGKIPLHQHAEEHEIFILDGEAKLLGGDEGMTAKKDDVVFIEPNEPHGYDNTEGESPFRFICVIPLLEE
jgi:quercetin dioxygenase-like cupin family protein